MHVYAIMRFAALKKREVTEVMFYLVNMHVYIQSYFMNENITEMFLSITQFIN